jgi:hypothetical protein
MSSTNNPMFRHRPFFSNFLNSNVSGPVDFNDEYQQFEDPNPIMGISSHLTRDHEFNNDTNISLVEKVEDSTDVIGQTNNEQLSEDSIEKILPSQAH